MKILALVAAIGASALSITAVTAQPLPQGLAKTMKGDTNGDKIISRAEFIAQAEARFAKMDTDKNGQITQTERRAAHMGMRGMKHGKRGGGMPGMMAQTPPGAEPQNGPLAGMERMGRGGGGGAMLARLDTDGDGRISKAEYAATATTRYERMAKDRGVSRADFDAREAQRFARLDSNSDGYIDAAERTAAMANRPGRGMNGDAPPPPPPPPAK